MLEGEYVYEPVAGRDSPVEKVNPKWSLTVQLPRIRYESCSNHELKELASGMHTDMILSLRTSLKSLKPNILQNLLIEGRLLQDEEQFKKLREHPLHKFFFLGREHLTRGKRQQIVTQYLLPNDLDITLEEARKYSKMNYTPSTLSKELGFQTVWYPAIEILNRPFDFKGAEKSVQALLGG